MPLTPVQHAVYCFIIVVNVGVLFFMADQYSRLADDYNILKEEYNKMVIANREK